MKNKYMAERAKLGAEYLDKADPGWFLRIDTYNLDISGNNSCVTGQLYGDFNDWCVGKSFNFLVSRGFYVNKLKESNWSKLTYAWYKEILSRLAKSNVRNLNGSTYPPYSTSEIRYKELQTS